MKGEDNILAVRIEISQQSGNNQDLVSKQRGALLIDIPERTEICEGIQQGLYGRGNYTTWHTQGIYGHPMLNWDQCGILPVTHRVLP